MQRHERISEFIVYQLFIEGLELAEVEMQLGSAVERNIIKLEVYKVHKLIAFKIIHPESVAL